MLYRCSECDLAVIIIGENVLRPCGHVSAIIAEATAEMFGVGAVK
jgi:hypothetical protein